jgi:hypothetical protein
VDQNFTNFGKFPTDSQIFYEANFKDEIHQELPLRLKVIEYIERLF